MIMPKLNLDKSTKPMKIIDRNVSKTIVKMTFEYKNQEYYVEDVILGNLEKEATIFLYEDGNYSDDSTRARLINKAYGNNIISKLPLGSDEIDLLNIEIEYR